MNLNLYGHAGQWLMVDCGVTFNSPLSPQYNTAAGSGQNAEILAADPTFISQQKDNLCGIVITHAHEDHIGAVPYFAGELGVPLYATPFTADLVARKLEEAGLLGKVEIVIIEEDHGEIELGPFTITYLPLAHSIAEGNALLIDTPHGRIFHTGDWKLDDDPIIGEPTTEEELREIGDEGVLALVCDSTNVFNPNPSGSEGAVHRALMEEVARHTGKRVVVTTFASNVARLQTLGEVARETGRQICVAGRSLDRIIEVAQDNGYLADFPKPVSFDTAMGLPRGEVLIIATGGQGEPRAALGRMADMNHPIELVAGDVVLFSSRQIPGNEIPIGKIQNQLAARGIQMVTDRQALIHVSGHPCRDELRRMYMWAKPQIAVPVHGERRHMAEQARFGLQQGISKAIVQSNGDVVRLAPGEPKIIGKERTGRLILDGDTIIAADGATLNERRRLSWYGLISVAFALDAKDRMLGSPQIRLHGVPIEEDLEDFLEESSSAAAKAVKDHRGDYDKLRETVRLAVRRVAVSWTGKKPIVDVLIVETA
mgnify:CR=1 FL=1